MHAQNPAGAILGYGLCVFMAVVIGTSVAFGIPGDPELPPMTYQGRLWLSFAISSVVSILFSGVLYLIRYDLNL